MKRFSHPAIKYELEYDDRTGYCKRLRGGMAEEASPADLAVALLYEELVNLKASLGLVGASKPVDLTPIEYRLSVLELEISEVKEILKEINDSLPLPEGTPPEEVHPTAVPKRSKK
jgi:hypothetical protein